MSVNEHRSVMLLRMARIDGQFPLSFANGTVIPLFTAACHRCLTIYHSENIHGQVTKDDDSTYTIDAAAICNTCNTFANFQLKASDDHSFSAKINGQWVRVILKPPSEPSKDGTQHSTQGSSTASSRQPVKKPSVFSLLWAGWFLVYVYSIFPAILLIVAGDKNNFNGLLLNNAFLVSIGYACSVILIVRNSGRKLEK